MQLLDEAEEEAESRPLCITQHEEFRYICLRRSVLTVALYIHRHRYGTSDVPTDENRYSAYMWYAVMVNINFYSLRRFRFIYYRQLVWWAWQ